MIGVETKNESTALCFCIAEGQEGCLFLACYTKYSIPSKSKKQEKAFGLLPSRTINQYITILEYLQPIEISQLIILDESIKI